MIISASRRTDLPAFYGAWLMNRVRAGYCLVPNPMNPKQVARVSLAPESVTAIVFWTKDPQPFLRSLDELDARGYRYYFQYSITGHGPDMEPYLAPLERRLATFAELSKRLGPERVIWRYDPIILSSATPHAYHARRFEELTGRLAGLTRRVVVSLADYYRKTDLRLRPLEQDGVRFERTADSCARTTALLRRLRTVAEEHALDIRTCAEPNLGSSGIQPGRCVDAELVDRLWGVAVDPRRDPHQRAACGCHLSKDIGVTDTCLHGCRYCYATRSHELAVRRAGEHDPDGPALSLLLRP